MEAYTVCPAWANALDANRPKPFEVPVTTIILRIPISDPFSSVLLGLLTGWRQTSSNGQIISVLARRTCPSIQYPSPAAEEPRVEVGDVALPSSFEGRGELKKRTNFI
jgi:hypothetical protein